MLLTSAPVTESLVVSPAVTLDVFWPGRTVGSISRFSGRPSGGGHGQFANLASSSGESDARLSTCIMQRHMHMHMNMTCDRVFWFDWSGEAEETCLVDV